MLNKVMLIGRLGRDPELRYTQTGSPVTKLNVATDESYIDRDGNKVEKTEWHSVVVFQRQAENCANYLAKGSLVYIEGSLQTRKWQDQQGQDRYTTEVKAQRVQFLERKGARDGGDDGYRRDNDYGHGQRGGYDNQRGSYGRERDDGGYGNERQNRYNKDDRQDDYGQRAPRRDAQDRGAERQAPPKTPDARPAAEDDDLGPAFPSEAGPVTDEVPF